MYFRKSAFTIIELIVAISIAITLMIVTYLPYWHYQNKAKLKLASREISQSFYEAKAMAVSWIKDISWNRSIALYFNINSPDDDKIVFFTYPHNIEEDFITNVESWNIKILKTKLIQDNIKIDYLNWKDNLLFFYDSITWSSKIYTFNSSWKTEVLDNKISIKFSYKKSLSDSLRKELIYFKNTNIIDYN